MAGRPAKFNNDQELSEMIEAYFAETTIHTITGLALFLGFESRQSFYDYEKNEEFSYTIKRARLRIEHSYELRLNGAAVAGAIFGLKNLGWSDKQETTHIVPQGLTINYNRQSGNDPLE